MSLDEVLVLTTLAHGRAAIAGVIGVHFAAQAAKVNMANHEAHKSNCIRLAHGT